MSRGQIQLMMARPRSLLSYKANSLPGAIKLHELRAAKTALHVGQDA
jgi:hypothetical protein